MKHISGYISALRRFSLQYYGRFEEETGIRGVQYPYLFYICCHEGCRQEELAGHLHVNKSNITRQLDKLQQNGFIDIRPDELDGRSKRVWPTAKAMESRERVRAVLEEWNNIMCGGLTDEEQETLKTLLDKTLCHIKEWEEK